MTNGVLRSRKGKSLPETRMRDRLARLLHKDEKLGELVTSSLRIASADDLFEPAKHAMRLVLRGEPIAKVAQEVDVAPSTVRGWWDRFVRIVRIWAEEEKKNAGSGM